MTHVSLIRLDVKFFARVHFDGLAHLGIKISLFLQCLRIGWRIARLGQVLRQIGIRPHKGGHRFVKADPQWLSGAQRFGVAGMATEIVNELLNLLRRRHRRA